MADEPTGALDSNTGKQVFETLKKLSQSKLVIVVSHDRDFAEQYGDRIIELKDGKIISDVSKTSADKKQISENVTLIGDTICVKSGKELTDSELQELLTRAIRRSLRKLTRPKCLRRNISLRIANLFAPSFH